MTTERVPGHTLVSEGAAFMCGAACCHGRRGQSYYYGGVSRAGHGLCSCGALSPYVDSGAARKRWHRSHKDDVVQDRGNCDDD